MVPLTILTGWLGAGKSTLLQYIMHQPHGLKVAIIMNEFGDDVASLEQHRVLDTSTSESAKWLNLPNGCLCCAGVDLGLRAIEEMLEANPDTEWVLLEASGMADPCALVKRLWSDIGSGTRSYLDGVVCIVDASRLYLYDQSQTSGGVRLEAVKQAAVADVLVINKCDLADNVVCDQVIMNPTARRIKTTKCSVPLSHLYNLNSYSHREQSEAASVNNLLSALEFHDGQVGNKNHPQRIKPLYLHLPQKIIVDFSRFEDWLFSLLWEGRATGVNGSTTGTVEGKIYRVKGHIYGTQCHRYIQAVEQVYDASVIPASANIHGTFVLLIGEFTSQQCDLIKDSFYNNFAPSQ
jgi:G3E family GTPase